MALLTNYSVHFLKSPSAASRLQGKPSVSKEFTLKPFFYLFQYKNVLVLSPDEIGTK